MKVSSLIAFSFILGLGAQQGVFAEPPVPSAPSIAPTLLTNKPGRPPAKNLRSKSSKVPTFDMTQKKTVGGKVQVSRVTSIPLLDIGEEPELSLNAASTVIFPAEKELKNFTINKLPSPAPPPTTLRAFANITPAPKEKQIKVTNTAFQAPATAPLPEFVKPEMKTSEPQPIKVEPVSENQLKLLQALIFMDKKKYHMALALFAEITNDKEVAIEATYQLALSARAIGLNAEYKHQMTQVLLDPHTEWQKRAAISLALNAEQGDKALVAILDPKIDSLKLEFDKELANSDQYNLNRAKYYLDHNNLTQALGASEEVTEKSELYADARFLRAILLYRAGQLKDALQAQAEVLQILMTKNPTSDLRSVSALTLARMHFQQGEFKEAYKAYLSVDKASPEWTQAMIEQAWAQILTQDYEGAAGNMFSLHTSYFKKLFTPESYLVRTVGYLNLCQYGDGVRVITDFKKLYSAISEKLTAYSGKVKSPDSYYETMKTFFKSPEKQEIDGLPRPFLFELARHPLFISEQKMVNSAEDQMSKYDKITLELIKMERDLVREQNETKSKIYDLKKGKMEPKDVDAVAKLEKSLFLLQFLTPVAKRAHNSIKQLRTQGLARLEKEKAKYKTKASEALKSRFAAIQSSLQASLDQSDILNYELYSGAGEHLRYQMAGGEVTKKEHGELKPADGKSIKWEFKGEVWEDEIGHYRSGLKNVCPGEGSNQAEPGK